MSPSQTPMQHAHTTRRWLKIFFLSSVVATFLLIILGGVVRVTGSGLGCPDWPLCHGRVVPPLEFTALVEYSHRLVASLVTLLVAALGIYALAKFRHDRVLLTLGLAPIVLILAQAVLGGITVLTELSPTLVTAHMGLAAFLLGLLIVGSIVASESPGDSERPFSTSPNNRGLWQLALFTALGIYALSLLGAYVRGSGAAAACLTWPLCHGDVLPSSGLATVHMVHRFAAVAVGLLILVLVGRSWRHRGYHPWLAPISLLLGALFLAQVLAGAAMLWTSLSSYFRALHLALAIATWGASVGLTTVVRPRALASADAVVTAANKEAVPS